MKFKIISFEKSFMIKYRFERNAINKLAVTFILNFLKLFHCIHLECPKQLKILQIEIILTTLTIAPTDCLQVEAHR